MQDIEGSVLIKFFAVVNWCNICGVITKENDFSTFLFITCSSVYNQTVFSTKKRNWYKSENYTQDRARVYIDNKLVNRTNFSKFIKKYGLWNQEFVSYSGNFIYDMEPLFSLSWSQESAIYACSSVHSLVQIFISHFTKTYFNVVLPNILHFTNFQKIYLTLKKKRPCLTTIVVKLSVCDEISDFNAVVRRNALRRFSRGNLFNENGSLLRRYSNTIETLSECWSWG
jgi:hypothetical protein